jgi:predicted CoA-binding protein
MKKPVTLVLGASPNPDRYSFLATHLLNEKGFEVFPFGVKKGFIGEQPIINEWPSDITIDTVTLYLGPEAQTAYYDAILALAPRRIIFNPGTENPDLQSLANAKGIETLTACTLVMLKTGQY